jgi:hypothetical protein
MAEIDEIDEIDEIGEIDEIERILRAREQVEPSPGFSRQVMESVRREAATPPVIPFPWRRFAPGVAISVALTAAGAAALGRSAGEVGLGLPALAASDPALLAAATTLGWVSAALAGSYLLVRLAGGLVRTGEGDGLA